MATRSNLKENNIDSCLNEEVSTSSENDSSDNLSSNKEQSSADFKRKHKNISRKSAKSSSRKPQSKTSNYTSPSKIRSLTRVEELSSDSDGESNETSSNPNRKNKVYSRLSKLSRAQVKFKSKLHTDKYSSYKGIQVSNKESGGRLHVVPIKEKNTNKCNDTSQRDLDLSICSFGSDCEIEVMELKKKEVISQLFGSCGNVNSDLTMSNKMENTRKKDSHLEPTSGSLDTHCVTHNNSGRKREIISKIFGNYSKPLHLLLSETEETCYDAIKKSKKKNNNRRLKRSLVSNKYESYGVIKRKSFRKTNSSWKSVVLPEHASTILKRNKPFQNHDTELNTKDRILKTEMCSGNEISIKSMTCKKTPIPVSFYLKSNNVFSEIINNPNLSDSEEMTDCSYHELETSSYDDFGIDEGNTYKKRSIWKKVVLDKSSVFNVDANTSTSHKNYLKIPQGNLIQPAHCKEDDNLITSNVNKRINSNDIDTNDQLDREQRKKDVISSIFIDRSKQSSKSFNASEKDCSVNDKSIASVDKNEDVEKLSESNEVPVGKIVNTPEHVYSGNKELGLDKNVDSDNSESVSDLLEDNTRKEEYKDTENSMQSCNNVSVYDVLDIEDNQFITHNKHAFREKTPISLGTPSRKRKGQRNDSEVKPQKIAHNSSATSSPIVIKLKRVADPNSKRSTYERVCSPRKQALVSSPKPNGTRPCNHKSPSKLSAKKNLFSPESSIPLKELQLQLITNSDNRLINVKKEGKIPDMFDELDSDSEDLEIDINLKGLSELSPSKHKKAISLDSSSELFNVNIRSSSKKPVVETASKKLQKRNETPQIGDYTSPSKIVPSKFISCNENSPSVAKKSQSDCSPWKRTRRTSTSISTVMHNLEDDQSRILRSTPKKECKLKVFYESEEDTAIIQLKSGDESAPKKPQRESKTALKEVDNTDAKSIVNKIKSCNENSPSKAKSSPSKTDVDSPRSRTRRIPTSNLVCNLDSENARILRNTTPKKEVIIEEVDESEGDNKTSNVCKDYCTPQKVLRTYSPRSNSVQKHDDVRKNVLLRGKTPRKESYMTVKEEEKKENKSDIDFSTPNKNVNKIKENNKRTPFSSSKYTENCGDTSTLSSPLQQKKITVTTPISKKKVGRGFLTPSMAKKKHDTPECEEDALDATRKQLHISTIPKSLPCRDAEFSQIKTFLLRKIEHSSGGCMYISGVPGTGKTATVHAVIRTLQEQVRREELLDFDFVEVNGLRLTEPKQAYVRIYQALSDRKVTADQAQQLLNKRFSGNCKKSTIILVDELDYLCNRRQDVVYNILDWPTKRSSALVVLTISNTMDLPERTLKGRVTSRMGLTRLVFQPYSFHQLREIVQDRLCGFSTFHPDAVQLVARKVAAVSGDARRALDICRRTTELAEAGQQVTVGMVEQALTQIFSGPRVTVIQRLSGLSQLLLRSLRDVNQRTGLDETIIAQVYKHLLQIVRLEGSEEPTVGTVLQTCVTLVNLGLIVAEKGRMDVTRKLSLNVSSDDIHYALDNIRT